MMSSEITWMGHILIPYLFGFPPNEKTTTKKENTQVIEMGFNMLIFFLKAKY